MVAGKPVIVTARVAFLKLVPRDETGIFTPEAPHYKDSIKAINSLSTARPHP
jgi:hypothetical protein